MLKFPTPTPLGIKSTAKMTDFLTSSHFPQYFTQSNKAGVCLSAAVPGKVPIMCGVSPHPDSSDKMGIIKETPFSEDRGALTSLSHHELETGQTQTSLCLRKFEDSSP